MNEANRKQMIVERLLEDERLRGDLPDPAARELLDWATARAAAIAGDPARSDAQVDAEVGVLRRATLLAAISGEQEPARVLAHAEAQLAGATPRAGGERTSAALATLSDEPKPQAAEDERAVGAATAQPAHTQELHSLEPALRRRRSRLAPLLKRLRGGR